MNLTKSQSKKSRKITRQYIISSETTKIIKLYKIIQPIIIENIQSTLIVAESWIFQNQKMDDLSEKEKKEIQSQGNKILKDISLYCQFPYLQNLYIDNMGIHNLQFIYFINAPFLKNTSLYTNKITSLRWLNKTNFIKLRDLILKGNPISHVFFQRILTKQDKSIFLELDKNDNIIMQDFSGMAKLEVRIMPRLFAKGQQRIKQQNLLLKLKQRFSGIQQKGKYKQFKCLMYKKSDYQIF